MTKQTLNGDLVVVLDDEHGGAASGVVDDGSIVDEAPAADLPKGAVLNPNGTVTLRLAVPQIVKSRNSAGTVSEQAFEDLTFRRFNGADQRAIRQLTGDAQTIEMFARACTIRNPIMNALYNLMDAYDIKRAGEVIEYFFENGPTSTGP